MILEVMILEVMILEVMILEVMILEVVILEVVFLEVMILEVMILGVVILEVVVLEVVVLDAVTARSCTMQKCGICNNKSLQVNTCSWFGRENGSPYAYAICAKCGTPIRGTHVPLWYQLPGEHQPGALAPALPQSHLAPSSIARVSVSDPDLDPLVRACEGVLIV
jgi:hypothetical protein